jgi:hypothetical protein
MFQGHRFEMKDELFSAESLVFGEAEMDEFLGGNYNRMSDLYSMDSKNFSPKSYERLRKETEIRQIRRETSRMQLMREETTIDFANND